MNIDVIKWGNLEQKIFFDSAVAAFAPNTIQPLFYQGEFTGSEFNAVFDANKLYVCFELTLSSIQGIVAGSQVSVYAYDSANVANMYLSATEILWNNTTSSENSLTNTQSHKNIIFSRLWESVAMNYKLKFIGFKLTK